ncbi:hypothetical protein B0H13DRAFT_2097300, partial [Mycena leptocephala]
LPRANPLVTVTHPKDTIWVIELHNGQDNRLIPSLVDHGIKPALDAVERHWREHGNGAVIIVGRRDQDKFFSNVPQLFPFSFILIGLDLSFVPFNGNFFRLTFNPLLERLIKFPSMPIALPERSFNGCCSTSPHHLRNQRALLCGGFMLSLACDYRVMTDGSKRNAWLCMVEVRSIWSCVASSFGGILNAKIGDAQIRRKIATTAGIVDHVVSGDTAAVLAKAEELGLTVGGVWGLIKNDIYWDALEGIKRDPRMTDALMEDAAAKAKL